MGRPLGSKNKATRAFRDRIAKLDASGKISLDRLLLDLYADATSEDPAVRLPARRELLSRVYGLPKAEVSVEHELGQSATALLVALARSDSHRANAERLERWREQRRLAAVTVEPITQEGREHERRDVHDV
jgi:hypothetical protein